jgi:hypothetical protein
MPYKDIKFVLEIHKFRPAVMWIIICTIQCGTDTYRSLENLLLLSVYEEKILFENCNCICIVIVFNVGSMCPLSFFLILCAAFWLSVVCYFVWCVLL